MSDLLVAVAHIYTIYSKPKRRTSTPSGGFKPAIREIEWPQTYPLDLKATVNGLCLICFPVTLMKGV
jgi:hypothetical protein